MSVARRDDRIAVPEVLRSAVRGYRFTAIDTGCSPARVFRLTHKTRPALVLKHEKPDRADDLNAEADRLRFLRGRAPVPRVIAVAADDQGAFLLDEALEGRDGVEAGRDDPAMVVDAMARALRQLHRLPIVACPYVEDVAARFARARERIRQGVVDESDFDEERQGRSPGDLLREAERTRPAREDRVFTHGDPCLPNVLFDGGRVSGFVDCGQAGIADPYQDLALAARSIGHNLGESWVRPFFVHYGLSQPDQPRLAFYRLLDEFF